MSRSYRKTPICGITTAISDKRFKQNEHKRERRALNQTDLTVCDPLPSKVFGDPWNGPKDGKSSFDPEKWPQLMRK